MPPPVDPILQQLLDMPLLGQWSPPDPEVPMRVIRVPNGWLVYLFRGFEGVSGTFVPEKP